MFVGKLTLGKMMLNTLLKEGLINEGEHSEALDELIRVNSMKKHETKTIENDLLYGIS